MREREAKSVDSTRFGAAQEQTPTRSFCNGDSNSTGMFPLLFDSDPTDHLSGDGLLSIRLSTEMMLGSTAHGAHATTSELGSEDASAEDAVFFKSPARLPSVLRFGEDEVDEVESPYHGPPGRSATSEAHLVELATAPPSESTNLATLLQYNALLPLASNTQAPIDCELLYCNNFAGPCVVGASTSCGLTPTKAAVYYDRDPSSPPLLPRTAASHSPPAKLQSVLAQPPAILPTSAPSWQECSPEGPNTMAGAPSPSALPPQAHAQTSRQQQQQPEHAEEPFRAGHAGDTPTAADGGNWKRAQACCSLPAAAPLALAPGSAKPKADAAAGVEAAARAQAGLTLEFLEASGYFDMPLQRAAAELGVGITSLKKLCRQHGIERWPYRKRSSLDRLITKTRQYFGEDPQRCREVLAKLEAERAHLRGNLSGDIPADMKRYRQSIFKMEFKVRKLAGDEEQGTRGDALRHVCANSCKLSLHHLEGLGALQQTGGAGMSCDDGLHMSSH